MSPQTKPSGNRGHWTYDTRSYSDPRKYRSWWEDLNAGGDRAWYAWTAVWPHSERDTFSYEEPGHAPIYGFEFFMPEPA